MSAYGIFRRALGSHLPEPILKTLLFKIPLFSLKARGSQRYAPAILRRVSNGQSVVSARTLPTAKFWGLVEAKVGKVVKTLRYPASRQISTKVCVNPPNGKLNNSIGRSNIFYNCFRDSTISR